VNSRDEAAHEKRTGERPGADIVTVGDDALCRAVQMERPAVSPLSHGDCMDSGKTPSGPRRYINVEATRVRHSGGKPPHRAGAGGQMAAAPKNMQL